MLFIFFLLSIVLSVCLTLLVRRWALRFGLVDFPDGKRKLHHKPIPLAGGIACYTAFALVVVVVLWIGVGKEIAVKKIIGMLMAGAVLIIGGILDDKYNLKPWQQCLAPIGAALMVIASGIGLDSITHPLYDRTSALGHISLEVWKLQVIQWRGVPYFLSLPADFITFLWLMGMMYTTKFLDGLDGLVSGVSIIGVVFILAVSMALRQTMSPVLALIFLGAMVGFWLFNKSPASIFLGEGGSVWAGFMLAVLAIISDAKLTVTALVMGLPIVDVAWVIVNRIIRRKSPFRGDRTHLHFRLLDSGMSHKRVVGIIYLSAFSLGAAGLFFKNIPVLLLLGASVFVMALIIFLVWQYQPAQRN